MNQDWQEKEIKRLFHNERQANERLAPDFAETLEAALSKRGLASPRRLILRIAFATAALVAVAGFVFLFAGRDSREQTPSLVAGPGESVVTPPAMSTEPAMVAMEKPVTPARRVPGHRRSTRPAAPLISQWRSPTEFLLKTPGDELLRTVPRLGASSVDIKLNLPPVSN